MSQLGVLNKTVNEPHLLSNRFSWNNGQPIAQTLCAGPTASSAINRVKEKIDSGQYRFEECSCFCGCNRGILISEIDRYGLYYPLVICRDCGLVRANPRMDKAAYESFYANEYRDAYGASEKPLAELFALRRTQHKPKYQFIIENIALPPKSVVFDIGCDFGTMLEQFADNGHTVYGCDYGVDHLEYGRQKTGLPNLLNGGYEALAAIGEKADLVILSHVIEHFSDLEPALRQIWRLLKPTGICYVAVPGTYGIIKNSFLRNDLIGLLQNAHTYQFSLNSLCYVMECCGFAFIKGTEEIESFFRRGEIFRSKADYPREEYTLVLRHLQGAEKKFQIREIVLGILKRMRLYEIVKKIINKTR
jgi:2-polyprenyl-3-methyl-5-hydroxy-6-metoxy-1,4-benzoquinol methylase